MNKIVTVTLPDIGEGVIEGEVIEWLKHPNDILQQDEPVVIVMTDKATVELPSPHPGKLVKQYYKAGQIAIKDKPLYDIECSEAVVEGFKENKTKDTTDNRNTNDKSPMHIKGESGHKVMAAPRTRKLARQLNVNLSQIQGTGPEGRVLDEDVVHAQAKETKQVLSCTPPLRLPGFTEIPLIGIRQLMAKKMRESKDQIPHFSYFEQVDATRLVQLRHSFKEEGDKQGIGVTYMPFLLKALSLTLARYPEVNSSVDTEKNVLVLNNQHNIGIATTTRDGLIVPVLKNVQNMSLQELVMAYEDLKLRALKRELRPSEMKESTISISNFGVLGGGGLWATPIINFPEVAILAVAKIHKQPLVRNDAVVIRDVLNLSWSFDHRVIDGDLAVSFSHYFSTLLENPAPLL
jgi:pyruvate dehydrogenase E2 component (dihydrolipoamide acetyltransferase)/2-oxoisovalerate dehydrogenase E2 component (dihydrolipoyl transacylase)